MQEESFESRRIVIPGKLSLGELPEEVLLKIAIELDPEVVAETYEEGWSREDLLQVIKNHVKNAVGRQGITGWQYIRDVEIQDIEEF